MSHFWLFSLIFKMFRRLSDVDWWILRVGIRDMGFKIGMILSLWLLIDHILRDRVVLFRNVIIIILRISKSRLTKSSLSWLGLPLISIVNWVRPLFQRNPMLLLLVLVKLMVGGKCFAAGIAHESFSVFHPALCDSAVDGAFAYLIS